MNLKNYMIILGRSRNLSLRDMSKQLGFSPAHLSSVINGKRSFLKNLYDKICATFELDWVEKSTLEKYVVGNKETKESLYKQIKIYKKFFDNVKQDLFSDEYALYTCGWEENVGEQNIRHLYKTLRENIAKYVDETKNKLEEL